MKSHIAKSKPSAFYNKDFLLSCVVCGESFSSRKLSKETCSKDCYAKLRKHRLGITKLPEQKPIFLSEPEPVKPLRRKDYYIYLSADRNKTFSSGHRVPVLKRSGPNLANSIVHKVPVINQSAIPAENPSVSKYLDTRKEVEV